MCQIIFFVVSLHMVAHILILNNLKYFNYFQIFKQFLVHLLKSYKNINNSKIKNK